MEKRSFQNILPWLIVIHFEANKVRVITSSINSKFVFLIKLVKISLPENILKNSKIECFEDIYYPFAPYFNSIVPKNVSSNL